MHTHRDMYVHTTCVYVYARTNGLRVTAKLGKVKVSDGFRFGVSSLGLWAMSFGIHGDFIRMGMNRVLYPRAHWSTKLSGRSLRSTFEQP